MSIPWDAQHDDAQSPDPLVQLVYRSRLLGADRSVCNWGGGNTSAKGTASDFRGRPVPVLHVKGSGSDLAGCAVRHFATLVLEPVQALLEREAMTDAEMVDYLGHCALHPGGPRPSIETLLHAFLPAAHVDHTHPDAIVALCTAEEGEDWHRDGMRERKHHVFEDLEAAATTLVAEGWATGDNLGIMGGSNGGLLVGAALTRSPQRYRAVVCSAPLLDRVRYERFGLGRTWNDEFGTADDPTELEWLLSYSPYHHVAAGTVYPAVLFTVFDNDTRVDPLHARKMAAALQWATGGAPDERPILLRREAEVGHGARSQRRRAALDADELAFLAWATGLAVRGA